MQPDLLPSLTLLAIAAPTLGIAYTIFGIAGFGTALIAAPVLAQIMPVSAIVPLLALLDCAAAIINGIKLSDKIEKTELAWLVPLMMMGSLAGAWLLLVIPPRPMMLGLGVFVVGYAIYALVTPPMRLGLASIWVLPFGGIGGIFSAMFGSGGFIYAMYLSRRLADKNAVRATQNALLSLSNLTRVVIFFVAGVYSDGTLPILALTLVPAMLVGIYAGHHITLRMSRELFLRILHIVLIATGTVLVVRALGIML
jgi:uncharacterized membrane protein YfcA